MSNIVGEKIGLSGRLVGIGKIRKDGSKEFHWLKKPISNMMLSKGVDRLFKYNWGYNFLSAGNSFQYRTGFWASALRNFFINDKNAFTNIWQSSSEMPGAISFCSYGTDGTANDYTTTDNLGAMVARYDNLYKTSNNKENLYPFHGTRQTSQGVLDMRISHLSPAASSSVAVREIGYWGASLTSYNSLTNFGLTSRIVMPSPYYINAGEQLLTTYEIRVTLDTDTSYGQFQSMTDTGGSVLEYKCRRNLVEVIGNFGGGVNCHAFDFPYIDEQGGGNIWPSGKAAQTSYPGDVIAGTTAQPWRWGGSTPNYNINYYPYTSANNVAYTTDTTHEIPDWGTAESGLTIVQDSRHVMASARSYVEGSHEIIYDLILPQFWPNLSLDTDYADIAYLNVGGLAIKFGKMVDGVFTPQVCRKLATKQWKLSFKTSIKTPDDV